MQTAVAVRWHDAADAAVYVQPPEYDMGALAPVSVLRSGSGGGGSSGGAAPGARGSGGGKRPNPLDPSWKAGGAGQNLPAAPLAKPRKKRSLYSASKELGEATIDNCKEDGGKTRQIANYVDRVKRIPGKGRFPPVHQTHQNVQEGGRVNRPGQGQRHGNDD